MEHKKFLVDMNCIQGKQLKDLKILKNNTDVHAVENRHSLELWMTNPKNASKDVSTWRDHVP